MEIVNLPLDLDYEIAKHLDYDNLKNLCRTNIRYLNFCQTERGLELLRLAKERTWMDLIDYILYLIVTKKCDISISVEDDKRPHTTIHVNPSVFGDIYYNIFEVYQVGSMAASKSDFLLNEIDELGRFEVTGGVLHGKRWSSILEDFREIDILIILEKIKKYRFEVFSYRCQSDKAAIFRSESWDPKI